jgi:hypothetical protein
MMKTLIASTGPAHDQTYAIDKNHKVGNSFGFDVPKRGVVTAKTQQHERKSSSVVNTGWAYIARDRVEIAEHQERRAHMLKGSLTDPSAVY